jgi:hypothetical protein
MIILIFFVRSKTEGGKERREAKSAGSTFWRVYKRFAGYKKKQKAYQKLVTKKPKGDDVSSATEKAGKGAAKVAGDTEALEEKTTELEQTTAAMAADLENSTRAILDEVEQKSKMEKIQEIEVAKLEVLENKIRGLRNFDQIDSKTAEFVKESLEALAKNLKDQVSYEEQNSEHQKELVKKLRKAIADFIPIARRAKKELKGIKKKERKERKDFKKEFSKLKKAIRKKRNKLIAEEAKGDNADPALIAQLKKEISMLKRNSAELEVIHKQVVKANEIIELEIKQLRAILQNVIKIGKSQRKYGKGLKSREKILSNRLDKVEKKQRALEKSIEDNSGSEKLHGMVLSASSSINEYFTYYIKALKGDLAFEEKLKEILEQNLMTQRKMEAFVKLLPALDQSEEALNAGVAAVLKLVAIMYTQDVAGTLKDQAEAIQASSGVLEDEKRMDKYLAALNQRTEQETMFTFKRLNELIEKEEDKIDENETLHKLQSKHLADSMGTMMHKKLGMDKKYMGEASKFGEQLQKANAQAGAAYKEAMKTTAYQKAA